MTINYHIKNVYGVENMYITDSVQASLIRQLTGKKTIDIDDIEALKGLGFEVIHVPVN